MLEQANPQDAEKLRRVLTDQKAAEKLLSTPQAQALFQMLMKGDKPHG